MKKYNLQLKIFKCFLFFLSLHFTFFAFNWNEVRAQQVDLAISPPLLRTIIKPGKSIMVAYRLINYGDPTIITAKVRPFLAKDNFGNVAIDSEFSGPIRFSLDNANLEMEKPFFMKTNDSVQLLLQMRVPDGTPNGDYYYTLLAETSPPPVMEGIGSARTKASIGSNILITVTDSGAVDVKSKITLFDVISRFRFNLLGNPIRIIDSTDKIPVVLYIQNSGRNLFTPQGKIILRGNFGETADYDIVPQNVLAGSQRLVIATPSATFTSPTSLVLSGFFIGQYHLNANINFGENSPQIYASIAFIALPIKFTVAVLTTLIIAVVVIRRLRSDE